MNFLRTNWLTLKQTTLCVNDSGTIPGTDNPGAPEKGRTGWNPDSGFTPAGSNPRPRVVSGLS